MISLRSIYDMYRLKESKIDVVKYAVGPAGLYSLSRDFSVPELPWLDLSMYVPSKEHVGNIFLQNEFLIWTDERGSSIVFDLAKQDVTFDCIAGNGVKCTATKLSLSAGKGVKLLRRVGREKKSFSLTLEDGSISELEGDIRQTLNGGMFAFDWTNKEQILRRVSNEGVEIWSREKLQGGYKQTPKQDQSLMIGGLVCVYEGILWMFLNSGRLVGVDIDNGATLAEIGLTESNLAKESSAGNIDPSGGVGQHLKFDATTSQMLKLDKRSLFWVDLDVQPYRLNQSHIGEQLDRFGLTLRASSDFQVVESDVIYFAGARSSKIAVFDRATKGVIWCLDLSTVCDCAEISSIRVVNGLWYVHDRENNLHILERTEA